MIILHISNILLIPQQPINLEPNLFSFPKVCYQVNENHDASQKNSTLQQCNTNFIVEIIWKPNIDTNLVLTLKYS